MKGPHPAPGHHEGAGVKQEGGCGQSPQGHRDSIPRVGDEALVALHFHKRWPQTGGKSLGHSHQGHGAAVKQWQNLIRPQKTLTAEHSRMLVTEQQGPGQGQHVWPHAQTCTCVHP